MRSINFEMLWKRICLKYETFNIVARPTISSLLCLSLFVSSTLHPILRSTEFCDEELLRVAGFFRVTVKMNFFRRRRRQRRRRARFAERNARHETAMSILHKAKLRKPTMDMEKKHLWGKVKS